MKLSKILPLSLCTAVMLYSPTGLAQTNDSNIEKNRRASKLNTILTLQDDNIDYSRYLVIPKKSKREQNWGPLIDPLTELPSTTDPIGDVAKNIYGTERRISSGVTSEINYHTRNYFADVDFNLLEGINMDLIKHKDKKGIRERLFLSVRYGFSGDSKSMSKDVDNEETSFKRIAIIYQRRF